MAHHARKPTRSPLIRLCLPDGSTVEVYDPRPSTPPPAAGARPIRVITTTGQVVPMRRAS